MITFAKEDQKQNIIHIWQTSFPEDSQRFIDMYFSEKYRKEDTLVYTMENEVVSCLQMLPYGVTFYDNLCKMSYISGAATLPGYKNRGIMGQLLSQSFLEMRNRGDIFTTLIPQEPWLIQFYQKYGYTICFEYSLTPVSLDLDKVSSDSFSVLESDHTNIKPAYYFYNQYCKEQNLSIAKSFDDFKIIWKELNLFSGTILLCYESEKICGICFCSSSEEEVIIKDLIADSEIIKKQLIRFAMKKYPGKNLYLYEPVSDNKKAIPYGMGRILNVEKALQLYASFYASLDITIKVNDDRISENNGAFYLYKGNCIRKQNEYFDFEVDINLLTRLLFGYRIDDLSSDYHIFPQHHPYMSLMLD